MLKIYKASAGSGKTYTLAFEYIRTLLGIKKQGSDIYRLNSAKYSPTGAPVANKHRQILAITFTNKATEEMKRRIVNELDALSLVHTGDKDANYAKALCNIYGCTRQELADVAATALRQLLYDYHSFHVTTIDSFFQRVLRTFARELDRQGDFNIELNDISAVKTSVDTLLDDFNNNSVHNASLSDWLYNYLLRKLRKGGKTNFFNRNSQLHNSLVSLVSYICDEKFKPYAEKMRIYLADESKLNTLTRSIYDKKDSIREEVSALARNLVNKLDSDALCNDLKANIAPNKLLLGDFSQGKLLGKSDIRKDNISKAISGETDPFKKGTKASEGHRELYAHTLGMIRDLHIEYYSLDDIIECLDGLGLLGFAWHYLDNFTVENNTVLLSDTNHLLSRIIGKEETPFIYERMGMTLHNFLIDEFQDTSKMQWTNLKPLVANGLGEGNDSLIIGDEKQSIYRFRNSDSSLLHYKVANEDFPTPKFDTRISGNNPGENTNYRSSADIVRFNNSLFKQMAAAHGVEGFENVVQDISKSDRPGHVTFIPVVKQKETESEFVTDDPLGAMAENMLRQHSDGHYDWRDMAVLVNRHREAASVIDYMLEYYPQIPVLSDEALYVKRSPAVQLIIGVLKIMANSASTAIGDKGRKYPTPSELAMTMSRFEFFRSKGMSVEEAIAHAADRSETISVPIGIEAIKSRKPSTIPALIETIIHEQLSEADRRSQIAYLNAFQDFVADYCLRYNPSIKAFLSYWEQHKDKLAISSSPDMDAVTVMTIHKSKGLEFDCVHIPFGSWPENGKPRGQWRDFPKIAGIPAELCPPAVHISLDDMYGFEKSLFHADYITDIKERTEDTMNMTYVAYTRAGAELSVYYERDKGIGKYISAAMSTSIETGDERMCALSQYFDLVTGYFEMGEPTVKDKASGQNGVTDDASVFPLQEYKVYFHPGTEVLTKVADMLDLDTEISEDDESAKLNDTYFDDEARERGIMLHDTLSLIERYEDIDEAVRRIALRMRLLHDEEEELKAGFREMIDLSDDRIYRWFRDNERVMCEQSVFIPDEPEGHQVRRFDRVVVYADGSADVVDYKFTGEEEKKHHSQVKRYMSILRSLGYTDVRGYLWYPLLKKISPVKC